MSNNTMKYNIDTESTDPISIIVEIYETGDNLDAFLGQVEDFSIHEDIDYQNIYTHFEDGNLILWRHETSVEVDARMTLLTATYKCKVEQLESRENRME